MEKEEFLKHLLRSYQAYYDVHPRDDDPYLKARCDFHMENDQYVLFRKNVMNSVMCHEYCFVLMCDRLDAEMYRKYEAKVLAEGHECMKEEKGKHMATLVSMVVVADECDGDALKALKHAHHHEEFRFGLDGYLDYHTALVTLSDEKVRTNLSGSDLKKNLKHVLKKAETGRRGAPAGADTQVSLSHTA